MADVDDEDAAEWKGEESPLPPPHEQAVEDDKDTANPPEPKKSKSCQTQRSSPGVSESELEVEIVQAQELEFLDGVTRLALLESGKPLSVCMQPPLELTWLSYRYVVHMYM